jgi:signal recognition particle subunit SRP54
MFDNLTQRLQDVFARLRKRGFLREEDVDQVMREIRLALLEADVHYKVVKDLIERVRDRAVGAEIAQALSPSQQVIKTVHEELVATLGQPGRLELQGPAPYVLMLVGLQGSGKTTTTAKLARYLCEKDHSPLMVAADTYRPAAVTQLEVLGRQLNIPVYSEGTRDGPPAICANGVSDAKRRGSDVVLLDTAGRAQMDDEMMAELEAIVELVHPSETLLVADAMTGQEAVNIATGFNQRLGLTGLILTKQDGDARGGAAISMRAVTGVPIKFIGTGEKMGALEVFYPDRIASRILGMGDVVTLIERLETTFDEQQTRELQTKIDQAGFDLEDFLGQLRQVRRMGSVGQILDMMPRIGGMRLTEGDSQEAERQLSRVEAIILSMTPGERQNPKIINASRKRRIALGSGTTVQEVNSLLSQFRSMQRLIKQAGRRPASRRGQPRLF